MRNAVRGTHGEPRDRDPRADAADRLSGVPGPSDAPQSNPKESDVMRNPIRIAAALAVAGALAIPSPADGRRREGRGVPPED